MWNKLKAISKVSVALALLGAAVPAVEAAPTAMAAKKATKKAKKSTKKTVKKSTKKAKKAKKTTKKKVTKKAAAKKAAAKKAAAKKAAAKKAAAKKAAANKKAAAKKAAADKAAAKKAAAKKAAADKAAADKAAADKAAADKAAADKAAADKAAADKAAADKAAQSNISSNFVAGNIETAGKYSKKLIVGFVGTDITPFTVTKVSVSDGSNLSVSYSEEELETLGFNTNPGDGKKFNGYLMPQQGSIGWDTSNLLVTATVRLQNGKVITVTQKVTPVIDYTESNISSNFVAGNIETAGKYSKKLIVGFVGSDTTPFTVTKVSVSDGSNLSVSYSEEELETLGFNTNPGDGKKFNGYLMPQQGSIGWDTSNLLVTATVRLQDGKVITVTQKVTPVIDYTESNISSNFVAGNIETAGKYSKKLIVGFVGTDITPFTVTKVSVSDGSNLSVSYSEEELETLGFNTNPGDGKKFNGYLMPQQGSIGWDTSNLLVTATVRLQDGKVITVTQKVTPVNN
ncbi:hypothetical protein [Lactobacillus delbrueckii]|uniref:hypothetical protein n=1 Tax=Lactobacillus delbrueckii TaxID=1584 RepID=UPI003A85351D